MDDSQSSDIFSDTNINFQDVSAIDIQSYEDLLSKIKTNACENFSAKPSKLSNNFTVLLDDCSTCVFQGLDILIFLLEDSATQIDKICCYLEETICILQIISNSIKHIVESMAVSICTMKTFSTATGNIILAVFSHCKDCEFIYESHIKTVERQLKDLFRNCHELQLTYLMALEKHFIFDLTETEQQDILIETLDINLKIGELVQLLDVKTMAEQWKAYTLICEKYSVFLLDKDIFNKTTKLLVDVIHNNIKSFSEAIEEDKVFLRSLKVTSFSLKILLRICKIFKCGISNKYEHIVGLLQQILLYNSSYHEISKMSPKFINIINTHLLIPTESIITHLITEENFIKYVDSINIINLKDVRLLEYVLLLLSLMKALVALSDMHEVNIKMIGLVIYVLPYCHTYFNMDLKFTIKNINRNHGLFEHLMIHTLAVSTSLDSQHYIYLEKMLYEAILGTDYICAVFSSNLWVLLCSSTSSQLHLDTLTSLIATYQKLETNSLFLLSPQHINLRFTIENLFKTLKYPEKLNVYKQFSVYQEKNDNLWYILKVRNLPENLQMSAKKVVSQKVIELLELWKKQTYDYQDTIKVMKLASTCEFFESDSRIESLVLQGWCKVCPKTNRIKLPRGLDVHSVLYFSYLEALSSLTEAYYNKIEDKLVFIKILHIISSTLLLGNIEIIRLIFKLFCKLVVFQGDKSVTVTETLKYLLERDGIECYIYSVISNEELNNFFTQILLKEKNLQESLHCFTEHKSKFIDKNEWELKLQSVADNRYSHKCIQSIQDVSKGAECMNNDFESEEFDLSLEIENDSHPVNKKPKFDTNVENILVILESQVSQLYQVKENILDQECKTRIRKVCDKLINLL